MLVADRGAPLADTTADGHPDPNMPTMLMQVDITDAGVATRMAVTTAFPSPAAMEQMLTMGMDEGMSLAAGQIDGILAELATTR